MEYPISQLNSSQFPQLLTEISDPPKELYARGELPSEECEWLAVVGSRKYTPYGKSACEHLIAGLRGQPVVIVSGLALGIDAIAHKAALDAGLPTVAVPGSGLDWDVLYPRSNQSLARAILNAGGALLSEFEPSMKANDYTFPQRNRIMAGLCHATLLIEATERSGTLITARLATEYNRDLLAVPGSIFSESSKGTHQFLKLGARLVASSADILDALGIAAATPAGKPENLTDNEAHIFEALHEPCPRDALASMVALNATELAIALSTLEIKGLICEELGLLRRL
ncbi:DNA-protecting protein DprA [Candidatus Kaiserbacteria bacterium]|nr:DNA-protecting protein DprA [Candidatus Kaiserbacteria bacterium]